jgi:hypothetical protein
MTLTVAWMLTPSDGRSDGRRLAYLGQSPKYLRLDPPLFSSLRRLVEEGKRSVRAIENAAVLPSATYVSEELGDALADRRRYFTQVSRVSAQGDLVFFDPDNGLAVASVQKGRRNSSKYLYWDELEAAYAQSHSLIVYQHFPRRPRTPFIRELAARVHEVTGCDEVLALATSHVAFLVLPQPKSADHLRARLVEFSEHAAPYATAVVSMGT